MIRCRRPGVGLALPDGYAHGRQCALKGNARLEVYPCSRASLANDVSAYAFISTRLQCKQEYSRRAGRTSVAFIIQQGRGIVQLIKFIQRLSAGVVD